MSSINETLFVATAESEHIEMYLKAIWWIKEQTQKVKVSSIAKILSISQPSVVQMLRKLDDLKLVTYNKRGVYFTKKGEVIGKQMIRNSRLLEVMMNNALKINVDEEMVCGIEHHMKKEFTDALCTLLEHPKTCPHGKNIPNGDCCPIE